MRRDDDHDSVCASQAKHVVVVAPPGTGKTFLSVRLAGAIAKTLAPSERVLLITFSNQARSRLEEEASRQLDATARQAIEVTNYHRFFWRAVRAYRRVLGLSANLQLCSRALRIDALKEANKDVVRVLGKKEGVLESIAEWAFPNFRDERTPDQDTLDQLLHVVRREQAAGRLLFDDLGALFWRLLESSPTIRAAYTARYPVIIADEHQDASGLQDAFVRHFGLRRMIVLADPMQLIYGFRGSDPERLAKHERECGECFELRTPHRWHNEAELGGWLTAVRARLQGRTVKAEAPSSLRIVKTESRRGLNGMKPALKNAVSRAFRNDVETVAVLGAWNNDVYEARSYLSREGFFPRQIGSAGDFEEARSEIEQLPLLNDALDIAKRALQRIGVLVPTLQADVISQVDRRLTSTGISTRGRCNDEAVGLLQALAPILDNGAVHYCKSVVAGIDFLHSTGHHVPRKEAVRALRAAADAPNPDLEQVLGVYSESIVQSSHSAPRKQRGLLVMSAHQAKGKEFDAVVILNASARHFPDTAEGRRLFYVAVTRASRAWTIIAPSGNETPLLVHLL